MTKEELKKEINGYLSRLAAGNSKEDIVECIVLTAEIYASETKNELIKELIKPKK